MTYFGVAYPDPLNHNVFTPSPYSKWKKLCCVRRGAWFFIVTPIFIRRPKHNHGFTERVKRGKTDAGGDGKVSACRQSTWAPLNIWFAFLKTNHKSSISGGRAGSVSALNAWGNLSWGGHGVKGEERQRVWNKLWLDRKEGSRHALTKCSESCCGHITPGPRSHLSCRSHRWGCKTGHQPVSQGQREIEAH